MCGIFGCTGENSLSNTLRALKLLEYRGYDSVGIGVKTDKINVVKTVGRSQNLTYVCPKFEHIANCIGHTRWATHGAVEARNAHPFVSYGGNFAIVHNGVIDNWQQLKNELTDGGEVAFSSDTDSEVVAHLLERIYDGDMMSTLLNVANVLQGSFAIVVQTTYDDNLYFVKRNSPLVVGVSANGEYICSDIRCLSTWADKVCMPPDNTVGVVGKRIEVRSFDGNICPTEFFVPDKTGIAPPDDEVMLSEIFEIPDKIRFAKKNYIECGGIGLSARKLRSFNRIYLLGCGTAYHSGLSAAANARKMLDIDVLPVIASEFLYDNYPVDEHTLAFCISQSGETADTILCAKKVAERGGYVYAVTNTDCSGLVFAANRSINVGAGGEFAVASTKAYNCQLVTLNLLLADIAVATKRMLPSARDKLHKAIDDAANAVSQILLREEEIVRIAERIKDCQSVFFLGRTTDYPTAQEGALKMKEISYIHCEAYPAGELKHGALALVEKGVTVIGLATDISLVEKMRTSLSEVATRGADVVCMSPYALGYDGFRLPSVNQFVAPMVSVVPLQLLAYHVARLLGRDIDKPRNLAKSVTVE